MIERFVKILMLILFKTYIKEIEGFEYIKEIEKKRGKIAFAFWHGEQFFLIPFFSFKNIGIMVSLSRDGEKQAKLLSSLGYKPIRGSSSKGAISALIELIKYARDGNWTGFALDGPRGPIHQPKPGIIKLAYKTDAKIIPLRVFSSKKWILSKAWDKYFIPKPFSKVILSIRKPLELSGKEEEDLKKLKDSLE